MVRPGALRDQVALIAALKALQQVANQFTSAPLPEWEAFAKSAQIVKYPRRTEVPTTPYDFFLIVRGTIKTCYTEPALKGQVSQFFASGSVFAPTLRPSWMGSHLPPFSMARWIGPGQSIPEFTAHTLEDCVFVRLDYRVVQRLATRHLPWAQAECAFLWSYIEIVHATSLDMRLKDPATRYRKLIKRRGFREVVSQRDMAAYLGITESALSRIVHRLDAEAPTPPPRTTIDQTIGTFPDVAYDCGTPCVPATR